MAVRKKKQEPIPLNKLGAISSRFLASTVDEARKEYKDPQIYVAGVAERMLIGIPLPSLVMETLLCSNVLPFGLTMQVLGTPGSCKSGFGFEVARWFRRKGRGIATLLENESKFSPHWALSIFGHDDESALAKVGCSSMDDWQKKFQWLLQRVKKTMIGTKAEPGPGVTFPYIILLDSVMGKSSEEAQNRIETQGFAGRAHPVEALSLSSWFKKCPNDLEGWPFFFLFINHLKPGTDARGLPTRGKSGGWAPGFHETYELDLKKISKRKILDSGESTGLDVTAQMIEIRCEKNSLGDDKLKIQVEVLWWHEMGPDGKMRQQTVWDWHGATVQMLLKHEGERRKRIREVVDLTPVTLPDQTKGVYSKALGIPKTKAMKMHLAGRKLMQQPEIVTQLRNLFGIRTYRVYQPGVDYREQLAPLRRAVAKRLGKP